MPDAVMGGYATHWRVAGSGVRPALFLHCSLGHSGAWGGLVRSFEADLNIIAMDLPGHGRSGPWDKDIGWQEQSARMAIALLETFAEPADIVGHSFGATVALRIAATRPELVRRLVLAEPVLFSAAGEVGAPEFARHLEETKHMPDLLARGEAELATQQFSGMWGSGQDWAALPQHQRDYMVKRIELIIIGAQSVFGFGDDVMDLAFLASITVPVLLVEGDSTHEIIPAIMGALHQTLINSERCVIKGAGHMVPLTHVPEVGAKMREFLSL